MSLYNDEKRGKIFPRRSGDAQGGSVERKMLDKLNGSDSFRTAIRKNADGSTTTLRTRNGAPEFVTTKEKESTKSDKIVFVGETAQHNLLDTSIPYTITIDFEKGSVVVAAIPLTEYDGSDGTSKWKKYCRNRKWVGVGRNNYLYHVGPEIDMTRHGGTIRHGQIQTLYTGEPLPPGLAQRSLWGVMGLFDIDIGGVTYKAIANEVDVYNFNTGLPLSQVGYNIQRPTWSPVNHIFWNGVPAIFRLPDGKTQVAINVRPTYDNGATYLPGGTYTFDDVSGVLTKIAEDATHSMVGQVALIRGSGYFSVASTAVATSKAFVSGHLDDNTNFVPLVFETYYGGASHDNTLSYSSETNGSFTVSVGGFSVTETFSDLAGDAYCVAGGKTFASHLSAPEERVHLVMFLKARHPSHSGVDSNTFLNTFPDTTYTPVVHLFDCKKGRHQRFELAPKSLHYEYAGRGFAAYDGSIAEPFPFVNATRSGAVICDADGCQKYASGVAPEAISVYIDDPGSLHDVISYNPSAEYPLYSLYGAIYADAAMVVFSVRNPKDPTIVLNMAIERKTGKKLEFNTPDGKSFQLLYEAMKRMKDQ